MLEKKAQDVVILNIGEKSSFADFFVIASAQSERQVRAIGASVAEGLKKQGVRPIGHEGENLAQWVLVDYGSVVAHIFHEGSRFFYDLEGLWSDVPREAVGEAGAAAVP